MTALFLFCALLTACGFHLRGDVALAPELKRVNVSSSDGNSSLRRNIQAALKRGGATIEENPGAGIADVRMTGVGVQTVIGSVGSNARVNEFNMVYHVDLEIIDSKGKTVLEREALEQSRSFTFDQTQAIGTGTEQATIQREMERGMAQAIMRKIDSVERKLAR